MKPTALIYAPYASHQPGAAGMRVHHFERAFQESGYVVRSLSARESKGWPLAQRIASIKPSVVLATSPPLPPLAWVWLGARWCNARFVLDAKEDGRAMSILSKKRRSLKERAFLSLRKFLYESADQLWFLTPSDQREAMNRYRIPPHKARLVPNGVDFRISFNPSLRKKTRSIWRVPPSQKVVVFAGSIGDEDVKGFIQESVRRLNPRPFTVFAIAHDSSESDQRLLKEFHQWVSENELGQSVMVLSNVPVSEMSGVLSAADVGVIPWKESLPTSLPVKLFDYAAAGLRVVAKCPRGGELDAFIQSNPFIGTSSNDWISFNRALRKEISKRPSADSRKKKSREALNRWDRRKIASEAVSQLSSKSVETRRATAGL